MKPFQKITLKNGLRILLIPEPKNPSTTVLVAVATGSKYETRDINGISHFLEHMCFKGTKKRPTSMDISSELDAIGALYNASTSHEYTCYYAKAQPKHFDTILDIISDIYLNPVFDQKEIEKERGVIIEELNMYEDDPRRKIGDFFLSLLYGDQPAGWDIGGRKEVIKKLNTKNFVRYHNEHYLAKSSLVVISGNFNKKQAVKKIKQVFTDVKTGKKTGKLKTKEKQLKPGLLLKYKKTDQTHLVLGVRTFSLFDKRQYILEVLSTILGKGMSSRLWKEVREELSAAYYVFTDVDLYTDHGYLAAFAGVNHAKVDNVIKTILKEFKKLCDKKVSEKELNKAKDKIIGNLSISIETSDQLASFYGGQEILQEKIETQKEIIEKIQAVEARDIQKLAKYIFRNNKLNLALIGPFRDKNRFKKLLHF